ncbi:MAG: hypothetical protein ACE367_08795 [Acidimicrobiales bacterium]
MFEDAANSSTHRAELHHSVIWSSETFETMARRYAGDTNAPDPTPTVRNHRDGVLPYPTEAIACAMVHAIRRMIVAKGTVIDLGDAASSPAQPDAARAASHQCIFIGCCAASACEIDHLTEHSRGGRTNPGNGGPDCGMHNRFRQKGFTVYRDEHGQWHTLRPDGTEIP